MPPAWKVLAGCGVVGGAFGLGLMVAGQEKPPSDPRPRAAPSASPKPRAGGVIDPRMVCIRRDATPETGDLEALRGALRWCESRLSNCDHRQEFRRKDWPEAHPVETPENWTETVTQALEDCGIDLALETIECTEYPCLAAFRPPQSATRIPESTDGMMPWDKLPYAGYRREVERALADCKPLVSAFGGSSDSSPVAEVFAYDAPCGDGLEDVMVLSVMHPEGEARSVYDNGEFNEIHRWVYRRAEDISAIWPCSTPTP